MAPAKIILLCGDLSLSLDVIRCDVLKYLSMNNLSRIEFANRIGLDKWTFTRFISRNLGIRSSALLAIMNEIYCISN